MPKKRGEKLAIALEALKRITDYQWRPTRKGYRYIDVNEIENIQLIAQVAIRNLSRPIDKPKSKA